MIKLLARASWGTCRLDRRRGRVGEPLGNLVPDVVLEHGTGYYGLHVLFSVNFSEYDG